MENMDLTAIRQEIDKIDADIVKLIDKRFKLGLEVGKIKKSQRLPIFNPKREEEILQNVSNISENPSHIKVIFQLIMDECKKAQEKI